MLKPKPETVICDNCFKETPEGKDGGWQTVWLFPSPDDVEPSEGRVDACSDYCRSELIADGLWRD